MQPVKTNSDGSCSVTMSTTTNIKEATQTEQVTVTCTSGAIHEIMTDIGSAVTAVVNAVVYTVGCIEQCAVSFGQWIWGLLMGPADVTGDGKSAAVFASSGHSGHAIGSSAFDHSFLHLH